MTASTSLIVLLQHKDLLSGLGHDRGRREASNAAADDDGVEVLRNFVDVEGLLDDGVPFFLVGDVLLSRLTVILESINVKL